MAFPTEQPVTPSRRLAVSIQIYIPSPDEFDTEGNPLPTTAQLGVQIEYSDFRIKERKFNLLASLQDDAEGRTHLTNLQSLKIYILGRIESELLGGE